MISMKRSTTRKRDGRVKESIFSKGRRTEQEKNNVEKKMRKGKSQVQESRASA